MTRLHSLGAICLVLLVLTRGTATAGVPPSITVQPLSQVVIVGTNYTFNVAVTGDQPLQYQWQFNSGNLTGQTNPSLSLINIQTNDAGNYQVQISNLTAVVTSSIASLIVHTTNDAVFAPPDRGWTYIFTGNAASPSVTNGLDGTWNRQNGTDSWAGDGRGANNSLPGGVQATNGILTIEDDVAVGTSSLDNRRFYLTHNLAQDTNVVNATNLLNDGVTLTFRARLTPPPPADPLTELTNAPNGFVNVSDGKGMFGLRQAGSGGMLISFSLNEEVEDLSTNTSFNFTQSGLHMNNLNGDLRSPNVDPGEGGQTNLLALDPAVFHEFWITIQDNGAAPGTHKVSIYMDGDKTANVFNVTAGTGSDGPAANYLALGLPSTPQRGAVDVDFFGYKPGVILPAGFNDPVGIVLQPTNQFVGIGETASFNVGVTGAPPYSFQWYKNAVPINQATNASYTTPPTTGGDSGATFIVVVGNLFNTVTSSPPALLSLPPPPLIVSQPQSITVTNGDPAMFLVSAQSSTPMSYLWRFNGQGLNGETNSVLNLTSTRLTNAGNYDVIVSNDSGSVTSTVAVLTVQGLDFGDAPPPYPTLLIDNGARHRLIPGIHLGNLIDAELDGQPDATASGDDLNGINDDDGVVFQSPLFPGRMAVVQVVASTNGFLDAWIDFDGNGSWADAGDQIFASQAVVTGTNRLNFFVSPNAAPNQTFARFRFSTSGGLPFDGPASDGEVEDYSISISPLSMAPPLFVQQPQSQIFNAGGQASLSVLVSGGDPLSYQWFFEGNPLVPNTDSATLLLTNVQKSQSGNYSVVVTNAAGAITSVVARLTILEFDFGDAPDALGYPTLLIFNGARHKLKPGVYLGRAVDFEPDGQPNATATGDDLTGINDDDGVVFTSALVAGQLATVDVIASTNGFLDAWIDFNGNGTWADTGEQVFTSQPLSVGTNHLSFSVPASTAQFNTFARFRFSTAGQLSFDGPAPDGEVEDYQVAITPAVDLSISIEASPTAVLVESPLTYTITVTNGGPSTATGVTVLGEIPAGASLVAATASQGACTNLAGVVNCQLGELDAGSEATITLIVAAHGAGLLTNTASAGANELELNPADNATEIISTAVVLWAPFANNAFIDVPDVSPGVPYPSMIFLSGVTATVYKVSVTLSNLTHTFPADLDILLVGPQGQNVILMSDAGTGIGSPDGYVTLTFDDDSPLMLPESSRIISETFKPTNYGTEPDNFPSPAPPAPYGDKLSVFRDTDPNGVWSLYVIDDQQQDSGSIVNGWSLSIESLNPFADLVVAALPVPGVVPLGSNLTYTVFITNSGPITATGVAFTNSLPAGVDLMSVNSSRGACSTANGLVTCALGNLPVGSFGIITITVVPTVTGLKTNSLIVSGNELDLNLTNNGAVLVSMAKPVTDLVLDGSGSPALAQVGQQVVYTWSVTNRGPAATVVRFSDPLPSGLGFSAVTASQGSCANVNGTVLCDLGSLPAGGSAVIAITAHANRAGIFTHTAIVDSFELDLKPADNSATLSTTVLFISPPLSNANPITIPTLGSASPYPSVIQVSGLTASVYKVSVTLNDLNHPYPQDLDILLVGPHGQSVMLMSDTGEDLPVSHLVLSFDDAAASLLPKSDQLVSGTFQPTDYNLQNDSLPSPAPPSPYQSKLEIFKNTDPNGSWLLYVFTKKPHNQGSIAGGWTLNLTTIDAVADLGLTQVAGVNPLALGNQFTNTFLITNAGPEPGTGITLTDSLAQNVTFVSAVASQGSCTNQNGTIICNLGSLPAGSNAFVSIIGSAAVVGFASNSVYVSSGERDPHLDNNGLSFVTEVGIPPAILVQPQSQSRTNQDSVTFTVIANGTQPLLYQWQRNGTDLLNATNPILTLNKLLLTDSGSYDVRVSNRVGSLFSVPALLTVLAPPTISPISNLHVDENVTASVSFTVSDVETPAANLVVSGNSSDPILLPNANLIFGGSGQNRTLTMVPTINRVGPVTVTVTVTDGDGLRASTSFLLGIGSFNVPPTISTVTDQTIDEDTPSNVIPFIVGDEETPANSLLVSAQSSNPVLVPPSSIFLGGADSNRTVRFLPSPDRFGSTIITLTVTDGDGAIATASFALNVNPVNDPPTLDPIPNLTIDEDAGPQVLILTGISSGPYETDPLSFSVLSSNPGLIPSGTIDYTSPDAYAFFRFTPQPNSNGVAVLTVTVNDGGDRNNVVSHSFTVTVNAINDAPSISSIANQTINEDTSTTAIPFTVADVDTPLASLTVSANSSNPSLVPASNILLGGSGSSRSVTVTPAPNQFGTATINIRVSDGQASAISSFLLTVEAGQPLPFISFIPDQTIDEDTALLLPLVVGGGTTSASNMTVAVNSSNPALVPQSNMILGGDGPNRTLSIIPLTNQFGAAVITLSASDGSAFTSEPFRLTVTPVNDPPTLAPLANITLAENAGPQTVSLAGITAGPANETDVLSITAQSSNPTLIPDPTIHYTNGNSTGTLVFAPVPRVSGTADIAVTVNDGQPTNDTMTRHFIVTVSQTNTAPVISAIADQTGNEDTPLIIPFTISDGETLAMSLAVSAVSTNTALVPNASLFLDGNSTNRTLTLIPTGNQSGQTRIILTVSDGTLTVSNAFNVLINAVNDPPTLDPINDVNVNTSSGNTTITVPLSGITSGAANESQSLTVTAASSNTSLVPNPTVSYTSPSTTGSLSFKQANNVTGSAVVTVTVNDGQASNNTFSRSFTFRAKSSGNTPPTISSIASQVTSEDTPTAAIPFTIGDSSTPATSLTLAAIASNPSLTPVADVVFGGSGSSRTVTITPALNQFGTSTITIFVTDTAFGSISTNFLLTVNPVNDPPTISTVPDQIISENATAGPINFTVGDVETPVGNLIVTGSSSNPSLIPNANLIFGGSGANRALLIRPATNQIGSATVTLNVSDGSASASANFLVTVNLLNSAPVLSSIPDQSVNEDTPTLPIQFTVGDAEMPAASLTVSGSSSNPVLIPVSNINFGGSASNRSLTITPASNQFGSAIITIAVTDSNGGSTSNSFVLSVNPVNDPPFLDPIADQEINQNAPPQIINLTGISAGPNETQVLAISAQSSNPGLIPDPSVNYTSPNSAGTLSYAPVPGASGVATITVTVNDGQEQSNLFSRSFVIGVDSLPIISGMADQVTDEDTVLGPLLFTISNFNPGSNLILAGSSSNPSLVPDTNIFIAGDGANRSLTVLPATNQFGTALITLRLTDAKGSSTSTSFQLAVRPVNDPPTLNALSDITINQNAGPQYLVLTGISSGAANEIQPLTLAVDTDNPALFAKLAVNYTSPESIGILDFQTAPDASGSAVITLTVNDGGTSNNVVSQSFNLTVLPVNAQLPSISPIPDMTINEDTSTGPISFIVFGQPAPGPVSVEAASSNPVLLPPGNILLADTGVNRTLTLFPSTNEFGSAAIALTVGEGTFRTSTSFVLRVNPVNDPPTLNPLNPLSLMLNAGTQKVFLTGISAGPANEEQDLTITALSSNPELIQNPMIVYTSPDSTGTLVFMPTPNTFGAVAITITVQDDGGTANGGQDSFSQVLNISIAPTGPPFVQISRAGPTNQLSFLTESGKNYFLEFKDSLTSAAWNTLSTMPGTGGFVSMSDVVLGPSSRFYRIRVQ